MFTDIYGSQVTITVANAIKKITNVSYASEQGAAALLTAAQAPSPQRVAGGRIATLTVNSDTLTTRHLTLKIESQPEANTLLNAVTKAAARPLSLLVVETGPITCSEKFIIKGLRKQAGRKP